MNLIDLSGLKFGRLTVIERVKNKKSVQALWLCKCDCGNTKIVLSSSLRKCYTTSCGCYKNEVNTINATKHGLSHTHEYTTWKNIIARCTKHEHKLYKYYGGRGIKVCDRWMNFLSFFEDMGERPTSKHSIDRINNDGNYEPSNCKWSTKQEQAINRRLRIDNISGCNGVTWISKENKWDCRITVNKKVIFLGEFVDLNEAIKKRKEAESLYFNKKPS